MNKNTIYIEDNETRVTVYERKYTPTFNDMIITFLTTVARLLIIFVMMGYVISLIYSS